MCSFGSTECTGLSRCILNVLRQRGVQPIVSFTCLLCRGQVSGPWAHSQLALCRLLPQVLNGWYDSRWHAAAPAHRRYMGRMMRSIRKAIVKSLLYKPFHEADRKGSKLNKHGLSHVSHIHMNQTCVPHYLHQCNTWLDLETFLKMT